VRLITSAKWQGAVRASIYLFTYQYLLVCHQNYRKIEADLAEIFG